MGGDVVGTVVPGRSGATFAELVQRWRHAANLTQDETRNDCEKLRFLKGQIDDEVKKLVKQLGPATELLRQQQHTAANVRHAPHAIARPSRRWRGE